jgi:DNA-binding MarR family transcriptional regulator
MFIAHRAVEIRVHEALRDAGFADLTAAQARIAQRLSPNGIRITDLADQARVTKQTAGGLVDELERNGYVARKADPSDARARLVVLTAKGRRVCVTAAAVVDAMEREWRDHLGPSTYDRMYAALVALREITDPYR